MWANVTDLYGVVYLHLVANVLLVFLDVFVRYAKLCTAQILT